MSSPATSRRGAGLGLLAASLALASATFAWPQTPSPPPPPGPRLSQDELDFLQGRAGLAVGSGARALGMGGAFLARADDATAASWNPAGLSYLRLPEVSVVGGRNRFDQTNEDDLTSEINEDNRFRGSAPDFVSIAYPLELGQASGAAQLSFQRVFAFGGQRNITRLDSEGNEVISRLDGSGGFDVLALGTGVQFARKIRLGGTLNRWLGGFRQTKERLEFRPSQQVVAFDLSGWNVNLGAIWTPFESLNLGAVGKTPFSGEVTLRRSRTDPGEKPTTNSFTSNDVTLDFPGALGVGLSWRPRSALTLALDYTQTFWSEGRIKNFFTLPITGAPAAPNDLFDTLPYPAVEQTSQADTAQLRAGVEYVLIRSRLKLPFRVGYFNDRQYFRDANSKAPRFDGFTAGTGILAGPFLFDVAYVYEWGRYLSKDFENSTTHVKVRRLFASLIYRHRGKP